jgi:hypothetical protein
VFSAEFEQVYREAFKSATTNDFDSEDIQLEYKQDTDKTVKALLARWQDPNFDTSPITDLTESRQSQTFRIKHPSTAEFTHEDAADIAHVRFLGSLESDIFKLKQETSIQSGVQSVKLSIDGSSNWWRGNLHNILTVQLNENLPTSLSVNAEASDIKLDLSSIIAEAVNVDSGASAIWMKLGSKQLSSEVNIDTGVSSIELLVPKNSGVKVQVDGGLNIKDLPSDFVELSKDAYQSPDYDKSENKINITLDMGVSKLKLTTY